MTSISLFTFLTFFTFITPIFLSIIFIIYGKTKFHRIWTFFNLAVGGWGVCLFLVSLTNSAERAYDFWRFAHIIGIFVGPLYLHAVCLFCNRRFPLILSLAYFHVLIVIFSHLWGQGHLIYSGTQYMFNSIHYIQSRGWNYHILLAPWYALLTFTSIQLYLFSRREKNEKGRQAFLWFIFSLMGFLGGLSTFIPLTGIKLYPFTIILDPLYAIGMTYSVFRSQFLNVRVVLEKGMVYSTLLACMTVLYLIIVVVLEKLFQGVFGYQSMMMSIASAFFIGALIIPLRNKIQYWLDKVFYKGSQQEIAKQNIRLKEQLTETERFRMLAHLTGGIVTEIKNPLTTIMVYNDYLVQKKEEPGFIERFAKILKENTERINGLLQQLTDYSNPAALQLEEANIRKLINQTVAFQRNLFLEKKIDVVIDFKTDEVIHLKIDPKQIGQALLHVIMNAVESMPNGGTIFITTDIVEGFFRIIIRDTGTGVEEQYKSKIFNPFFSCKQGHTGLGLSISQGIIENHKGKIYFKSQENVGTEVKVQLPLS